MPCFSKKINQLQPICDIFIGQEFSHNSKKQIEYIEKIQKKSYKALIDTGATASCITEKIANELNLFPFSKREVSNTTGTHASNIYKVCFILPIDLVNRNTVSRNLNPFVNIEVIGIMGGNQNFDAIIGMDIISKGSLHITNGVYTFCV